MPGRVNDLDVGFEDEGQSAMEVWQFCRIRPDTRGGVTVKWSQDSGLMT